MSALYTSAPDSLDLTSLANFTREVLQDPNALDDDAFIAACIARASGTVVSLTGRGFERAKFVETVQGSGTLTLRLERRPIISVESITVEGSAIDLTDLEIENSEDGTLYNSIIWDRSYRYVVSYTAGYIVPGNSKSLVTGDISVDSATKTYSFDASLLLPTHLVGSATSYSIGDYFYSTGFTGAANNGFHRITSRSGNDIVVEETVTDEAVASRTVSFVSLPAVIEHATIMLSRSFYYARNRDGAVSRMNMADGTEFFFDKSVEGEVKSMLTPYAEKGGVLLQDSGFGGIFRVDRS